MKMTSEKISPSLFILYAGTNPSIWKMIEGLKVMHTKWGKCVIERVELNEPGLSIIWIQGHKVALNYFRDGIFSDLVLPSEMADSIKQFEQRRKEAELQEQQRQNEIRRQREIEAELARKREYEAKQAEILQQKIKQKEAERIQKEKSEIRSSQIREFCNQRGIQHLVHFSNVQNLPSILTNGLISRKRLESESKFNGASFNDDARLDGHRDAVCLSISFPNYKMFYRLRQENENSQEWVVLLLKVDILWELDCAFCQTNAAASETTIIPLSERKTFEALSMLFNDYGQIKRASLRIPAYFTTNPQAEILVFETIYPDNIKSVCFHNENALQNWIGKNGKVPSCNFFYEPQYFTCRKDYKVWQENGRSPSTNFDVPPNFEKDIIF